MDEQRPQSQIRALPSPWYASHCVCPFCLYRTRSRRKLLNRKRLTDVISGVGAPVKSACAKPSAVSDCGQRAMHIAPPIRQDNIGRRDPRRRESPRPQGAPEAAPYRGQPTHNDSKRANNRNINSIKSIDLTQRIHKH